ncbi:DUF2971 domain-containing protein [Rhizobium leguminosarum]|uniref:DUF2971 domain-containing protein n=1 Tax=Rhizobium leguminosarum TaxID=384 RepID=UPI003F99A292
MTLYHYCNTQAFWSIVSNRSIWLSDLSASNDSEEGQWVNRLFLELAANSKQEHSIWPTIQIDMAGLSRRVPVLGFCLSSKEDMLSQWRGYADDGSGFSIGFDDNYFNTWSSGGPLDIAIERVRYTRAEQIDLMRQRIASGDWGISLDEMKTDDELEEVVVRLMDQTGGLARTSAAITSNIGYLIKNPAFAEEDETRLIVRSDFFAETTKFRARGASLVAYRELAFDDHPYQPIRKVFIGPKNQTSVDVVDSFLQRNGFWGVEVSKSAATYR